MASRAAVKSFSCLGLQQAPPFPAGWLRSFTHATHLIYVNHSFQTFAGPPRLSVPHPTAHGRRQKCSVIGLLPPGFHGKAGGQRGPDSELHARAPSGAKSDWVTAALNPASNL